MNKYMVDHRSLNWWLKRWPKLKKIGSEYKGPCPNCGGKDRFWVRKDGIFNCRQCGEYRKILEAVGIEYRPAGAAVRARLRRRW